MKRTTALIGAATFAAAGLVACGDHKAAGPAPVMPPPSTAQQLDTAQVLALAQKSSEVSTPMQVDDGALTLTDSSESTQAISVNGM